ncbi:MAG: hypothetical protein JNM60_10230 [Candidatus Competibacteraceae bacterium]|nr:hypothetical protein [Candidatus Competibacteraceae bacterium]
MIISPLNRLGKLVCFLVFLLAGCGNPSEEQKKVAEINTDIVVLQRFISLPAKIVSGEWQTGEFAPGRDWWLAAVLKIEAGDLSKFLPGSPDKGLVEMPPGLQLTSSFGALKSFPDAGASKTQQHSFIAEVYPVTPYQSSPLLSGKAVKLADETVFVLLWTQ